MNLTQLLMLSRKYAAVPVVQQFRCPNFDSLAVLQHFKQTGTPTFLLQRREHEQETTYLVVNPPVSYTLVGDQCLIQTAAGKTVSQQAPEQVLEAVLKQYQMPRLPDLPPFTGGLCGYFSYDYARQVLAPEKPVATPLQLPTFDLLLATEVIAYQPATQLVTLIKVVPSQTLKDQYAATQATLAKRKAQLLACPPFQAPPFQLTQAFHLRDSRAAFAQKVRMVQRHILAGDVFQLILSNPQLAQMTGSLMAVAPTLFKENVTPYRFYFQHDQFEAVGASPETLVALTAGRLTTFPLAGTRRRGKTVAEDQRLAAQLRASSKENAEHNMLIDLGRNDLGQVSQFGTVHVTAQRQLLRFNKVMHLGSRIESQVRPDASPLAIVQALLPAGTLAGAPKRAAMHLISQLEGVQRGMYGGCLGYLSFTGDLDLAIVIRLAYRQAQQLVVQAGAGIVADSQAQFEYQEFHNKARAILEAIQITAQGGMSDAVSD